jgi:hypothetical protein
MFQELPRSKGTLWSISALPLELFVSISALTLTSDIVERSQMSLIYSYCFSWHQWLGVVASQKLGFVFVVDTWWLRDGVPRHRKGRWRKSIEAMDNGYRGWVSSVDEVELKVSMGQSKSLGLCFPKWNLVKIVYCRKPKMLDCNWVEIYCGEGCKGWFVVSMLHFL